MRAILLVVVLSGGAVTMAQQTTPSVPDQSFPNHQGIPSPDQLFRLPPAPGVNQPHFKWEDPGERRGPLALPEPVLVHPMRPEIDQGIDRGMVVHAPQGSFAEHNPRPAESSNLYPGLKILPTEMAQLEPGMSPFSGARGIPIPTTWPNAKVEPIPTAWGNFTMIPVGANLSALHANAGK